MLDTIASFVFHQDSPTAAVQNSQLAFC